MLLNVLYLQCHFSTCISSLYCSSFMYMYFQPNKHVENYINNELLSLLTLELKALKMMDICRKSLGHLSDHRRKPMFTRITFKRSLTDWEFRNDAFWLVVNTWIAWCLIGWMWNRSGNFSRSVRTNGCDMSVKWLCTELNMRYILHTLVI